MKVDSFSFGSPVSAYSGSKPIFEIKSTEDKTNISTPIFYGSAKNIVYFGYMAASASQKAAVVVLPLISAQEDQEVLSLDPQKGEVNLRHFPKSRQSMLVVSDW